MEKNENYGTGLLNGYQITDFSSIQADLQAMAKFADELTANLESFYAPRLSTVSTAMTTELPSPPAFVELHSFLTAHQHAQEAAHKNVYEYANGTAGFATAASQISEKYSGSDAFSRAKVGDVNSALDQAGLPPDPADQGGRY
jgi:hypothetical protein